MPAALAYPLKGRTYNWHYESEPEPHLDGRRMHCPRGRVLGGSSSINGMAYVRGHARDYDRWAQAGLRGWDYAHLLPYFKRAETREAGADVYRGDDGPLQVATGAGRNPLYQAFIEAGQQAGYPFTADMNGFQQEGFGAMDRTTHRGRRWSAARAYLRPAHAAAEPRRAHPGADDAHPVRGDARSRRRLRGGRPGPAGPGRARGDPRAAVRSTRPSCSCCPGSATPIG